MKNAPFKMYLTIN